jgi:hypothetical protein
VPAPSSYLQDLAQYQYGGRSAIQCDLGYYDTTPWETSGIGKRGGGRLGLEMKGAMAMNNESLWIMLKAMVVDARA